MTDFLEDLLLVYNLVAFLGIIFYPFLIKRDFSSIEREDKRIITEKWKQIFHIIMMLIAIVIALIILIYGIFHGYVWIALPITILTILERTNDMYASLSIIRETISEERTDSLTKREKDAIFVLASAVIMLNLYSVPQKMIQFLMENNQQPFFDWILIIILIVFVTMYCFLIGVLVHIPLIAIKKMIRFAKNRIKWNRLYEMKQHFITVETKIVSYEFFSIRLVEWTLLHKKFQILWGLLIILIPVDLIIKVFCLGISLIITIGSYVIALFRRIIKTIICFNKWYEKVSDRKIVNVIFRLAFIISVSLIVIVNRYSTFLHNAKAATGSMEFLASAIVIPMIFTWIIDYRESTKKNT